MRKKNEKVRFREWYERHPQKAALLMTELNLASMYQEIRCPKCNIILKPAGIPIDGKFLSRYTHHVGSGPCLRKAEGRRKPSILALK